uniref:glucosidase 2 subunit beta-like n=1 Tax=Erigeron canadensis TaxID=72917 RepID=UPI001CB98A31|nr:glucosidase 2 subunit beta-like [Erigeron canadensis]
MKKNHTQSFLLLLTLILIRSAAAAAIFVHSQQHHHLLGVSPQDEEYYKKLSGGMIKCKDGSKSFKSTQLNDDFCDCPDGSDEPGTSACPSGKFYCRNAGHSPLSIFSSRVNDGICDCCDGSDEYDGTTKCKNTCWEAGKVARDRLRKKIATFQEGVTIRKHDVEQAKISAVKDEAELSRLKNEENILKGLVQQLKDRKEQIEKAEEKERAQKEKEEKQRKEAEEAKLKEQKGEEKVNAEQESVQKGEEKVNAEQESLHKGEEKLNAEQESVVSNFEEEAGVHEHSPSDQDLNKDPADFGVEVAHNDDQDDKDVYINHLNEENAEPSKDAQGDDPSHVLGAKKEDASEDTEPLSREELGRAIGSRWTGKKTEQQDEDSGSARDHDDEYDETSDDAHDEEYSGYDTEEDHPKYEDDDTEDHTHAVEDGADDDFGDTHKYQSDDEIDMSDMESTSSPSWLEKIQETVRKFLHAVNPFQTPVDTSESENVRKEYDDASAKLSKIQSRISSLTKKLAYDFGPEKEFYSLYGQCYEIKENKYVYKVCPFKEATQEEGHSTTRLGQWDKFDESYRIMLFTNGDKCWNGPNRSLTVRLRCGSKVEVADIDEPSRCEYSALLTTPALCQEGRLKELKDKLETANKDQPQGHDEL